MSIAEKIDNMRSATSNTLDFTAIAVALGTFVGWLPDIAAFLTVVYIGVRIYNELMKARDFAKRRKLEFGEEGD